MLTQISHRHIFGWLGLSLHASQYYVAAEHGSCFAFLLVRELGTALEVRVKVFEDTMGLAKVACLQA